MLWSDEGRLATLSAAMMAMADALSLSGTEAVEAALSAAGFNFARRWRVLTTGRHTASCSSRSGR